MLFGSRTGIPSLAERYALADSLLAAATEAGTSCTAEISHSSALSGGSATPLSRLTVASLPPVPTRIAAADTELKAACGAARGPHPDTAHHRHEPEGHRHAAVKPAQLVDKGALELELRQFCCQHGCLGNWKPEDASPFRSAIASRNEHERLDYIRMEILPHCELKESGRHSYRLQIESEHTKESFGICRHALLVILGISGGKLDHAIHLERLHLSAPDHANKLGRDSTFAVWCESWLARYIEDCCDKVSETKTVLPGKLP